MCTEVNNSQELELAVSTPPPGNGPLKGPRADLSLGFSSAEPEQPRDYNSQGVNNHQSPLTCQQRLVLRPVVELHQDEDQVRGKENEV